MVAGRALHRSELLARVNVWMGWPHASNSSGVVSSASEELIL